MNMSKKQYKKYVKTKVTKSPLFKNMIKAYITGGIICTAGQLLNDSYLYFGFAEEQAGTLTSITLVFLSAFLTSIGIYDKIAKHAGAGTLVPITGFANAVVSPAIEFKDEGYVLGVAANIFKIAGPVITYGVIASVVSGLIYYALG
ncbi:MAG: stage V sporulation protein AC [Clostridia bacterium]|nr:stage V sporulation protein AC [Clostridia bacterium]